VSHSAIHEVSLLLIVGFLTYFSSEVLGQSGITSLVTCSVIMAHYAWYNLSPQGKHVSSISIQTFGYAAEAFVFSYIGLCFMFYNDYPYCWPFIIGAFFIIVIGRYFGIVCSYYMFACFKGSDNNHLSFREISFATYAAFIRGAIAFGLVE
jgi:NhaP-type Na+/H+ or K+/H+ antiporter